MPANYILLERVTVGETAVSSITFNSIPQTGYTDLKIVVSARSNRASVTDDVVLGLNALTTNQTTKSIFGTGAAASSASDTKIYGSIDGASATTSTFGNTEFYIPNYTSANYKSVSVDAVNENNATTAYAYLTAGLWSSTAAVTSITMTSYNSASFVQYSTFSLYGLAAVGTTPTRAPKATGGSIIQTDGTYWYHAFLASGTFTPAVGLSCDVLVVAGGGGGAGYASGGGGGAGGLLLFSSESVTSTNYSVTVGGGGTAGPSASPGVATQGSTSQFGSLTASVGGGRGGSGGGAPTQAQRNGGSGGSGGGGGGDTSAGTSGSATSGQGNAGGTGFGAPNYPGGGGGGAGGVGANGASSGGANGGIGYYNSITNAIGAATSTGQLSSGNYYYAGGGGGGTQTTPFGTGGLGGGGNGGGTPLPTAGTANTGGGGGGTNYLNVAGKGGSGIVVIRYAV